MRFLKAKFFKFLNPKVSLAESQGTMVWVSSIVEPFLKISTIDTDLRVPPVFSENRKAELFAGLTSEKWLDNWEWWWIFPMKWSKKNDLKMLHLDAPAPHLRLGKGSALQCPSWWTSPNFPRIFDSLELTDAKHRWWDPNFDFGPNLAIESSETR